MWSFHFQVDGVIVVSPSSLIPLFCLVLLWDFEVVSHYIAQDDGLELVILLP